MKMGNQSVNFGPIIQLPAIFLPKAIKYVTNCIIEYMANYLSISLDNWVYHFLGNSE